MIYQAVHTGFGYFQREAGYTHTGPRNAAGPLVFKNTEISHRLGRYFGSAFMACWYRQGSG